MRLRPAVTMDRMSQRAERIRSGLDAPAAHDREVLDRGRVGISEAKGKAACRQNRKSDSGKPPGSDR